MMAGMTCCGVRRRGVRVVASMALVLALACASGIGCRRAPADETAREEVPSSEEDAAGGEAEEREEQDVEGPAAPEEPSEPMAECPLCGRLVPETEFYDVPLAVMIDNHPKARPQSGLEDACLVYEAMVEGGLTRLMPVYLHGDVEQIGPVRSARHYFVDLAAELGAAYAHVGGSPQAKEAVRKLPGVMSLDDMRGAGAFWRVDFRNMPHNLYTSTQALIRAAEERGWTSDAELPGPLFGYVGSLEPRGEPAEVVRVRLPGYVSCVVEYEYEPVLDRYLRFVDGEPHEEASGGQLSTVNVVIRYVETRHIEGDQEGRLDMDLTGEGEALVFCRGVARRVRWSRPGRGTCATYVDESGMPVLLAPGPTWIMLVPSDAEVDWGAGEGSNDE